MVDRTTSYYKIVEKIGQGDMGDADWLDHEQLNSLTVSTPVMTGASQCKQEIVGQKTLSSPAATKGSAQIVSPKFGLWHCFQMDILAARSFT